MNLKKQMINRQTGHMETVKLGFSWTTLFFGIFVPLFRQDWAWLIIMLIAAICTVGFSWLVMPFIYNGFYVKSMEKKGYEFMNSSHLVQPNTEAHYSRELH